MVDEYMDGKEGRWKMKYKIVIWGIGAVYNKHVNLLKYSEIKKEIEVVAVTSNDISPKVNTIDGFVAIELCELDSFEYDYLLIMNDTFYKEIREMAIEMGVEAGKIIHYKVLEIPHFEFEQYIKLKESRLSIISNNCWGGTVYNTLGLECISPFKNLFLEDDSYLRMLYELQYYLQCDPSFGGFAIDIHSGKKYPILKLDDVLVHCNHDDDYETAVWNWNRRLKKINMDNLFIEMYTDNKESAEKFIQLDEFTRKICFVPFECNEKGLWHLKLGSGQTDFWQAVLSNAGNGKNSLSYNIIDLLSGNPCNRCE